MSRKVRWLVFILILLPALAILYKVFILDYSFSSILPTAVYDVQINLDLEAYGDAVTLSTFLPEGNDRQFLVDETSNSGVFELALTRETSGRKAQWSHPSLQGRHRITWRGKVRCDAVSYIIDSTLYIRDNYPPFVRNELEPTVSIQSSHPLITQKNEELTAGEYGLDLVLRRFHEFVCELEPTAFSGTTDALTALRLGEASCNGKSRLFVALCRNKGIPARLVGGVILETGAKRTSHQWAEVYIDGIWIPMDGLNNHYASIPSNYMRLYTGDEALFTHTSNVGFDYLFTIRKGLESNPELASELKGDFLNSYLMWQAFERVGISLALLKTILLLPLGAMIVALARNVIGLKTYGVFLPALIAVAISGTGLIWGLLAFTVVIIIVSLVHFPLERLGLLYTPKLVIMLVSVVVAFIVLSIAGISFGYTEIAYVAMFPVVVITITAERFARLIVEDGLGKALNTTLQTLVVVVMCYYTITSRTMEAVFLAFPELFLVIIACMIVLGRWIGLRVIEYKRFRWLAQ
jgi:hypothetical protein